MFRRGDPLVFSLLPEERSVSAVWELCHWGVSAPLASGACEAGFDQSVTARIPEEPAPGFYQIRFTLDDGAGGTPRYTVGFGYDAENIPLPDRTPPDFDAFWRKALERNNDVDADVQLEFLRRYKGGEIDRYNTENASIPGNCAPESVRFEDVDLYRISFLAVRRGVPARYFGFFAVPHLDKPEKLPGLLLLPGAGCAPLPAPLDQARHGYAALMLHIHAMRPDQDEYPQPEDYIADVSARGLEADYYYDVIPAAVRAAEILSTRPETDPDNLFVAGGSQGGFLTVAVSALCRKVRACASAICWYGDQPYRKAVETLNRKKENGGKILNVPFDPAGDIHDRHFAYYDTMSFASRGTCPVRMLACLNDIPSPAHSVWNIFRSLSSADREIFFSAGTNHDVVIPFERLVYNFFSKERP